MADRIARRDFLRAAGTTGALLLARPALSMAAHEPIADFGTSRVSRLFPENGFVVTSDLHNHTLLSDGSGDVAQAYHQMRAAGIDVAALTDHTIQGKDGGEIVCYSGPCSYAVGIHDGKWQQIGQHADAADDPGSFTAIRGFEWTTGHLGHINVWLTENWTDPEETRSLHSIRGLTGFLPIDPLHDATEGLPEPFAPLGLYGGIDGFYEWLNTPVEEGGGLDGFAGFNHPRGYDFDEFKMVAGAAERVVSIEIFTVTTDFLFVGRDEGRPTPINACLNAGWKVGFIGVSDEHGTNYGLAGKGRGGLYISDADELTRSGVRGALANRRMYATRSQGLRIDAAANGVRMGRELVHSEGPITFALDIDRGPAWYGKQLTVQVLGPGIHEPTLLHAEDVVVPASDEPVIEVTVPSVSIDDGAWVMVRIGDPEQPIESRAPANWSGYGAAAGYPSPWFLVPPV